MYVGVILPVSVSTPTSSSIPHVCGGDPEETSFVLSICIGIPHVCGGDPQQSGNQQQGPAYSPCMWG